MAYGSIRSDSVALSRLRSGLIVIITGIRGAKLRDNSVFMAAIIGDDFAGAAFWGAANFSKRSNNNGMTRDNLVPRTPIWPNFKIRCIRRKKSAIFSFLLINKTLVLAPSGNLNWDDNGKHLASRAARSTRMLQADIT